MDYKGYKARIEYHDEDACFVGHVAGIRDVIGFHGRSVKDLRAAFEEAVNDYLEACEKLGRAPQKSFSGKILLRIDPQVHAEIVMCAQAAGKSLNQWVGEQLRRSASD